MSAKDGGTRRKWIEEAGLSENIIEEPSSSSSSVSKSMPLWLFAKLRQIRASMTSEVDAVVLVRLLVEEAIVSIKDRELRGGSGGGYRPLTAGEANENLDKDRLKILQDRYKASPVTIQETYARIMDKWKEEDLNGFIDQTVPYPHVTDSFRAKLSGEEKSNAAKVYIVSEMRTEDIVPILSHLRINVPYERVLGRDLDDIFRIDMRTDLDAIQNQNIGSELVYIDSNVERLVEYAEDTSLSQLLLCFATWGPSTPSMRSKTNYLSVRIP
eukprot:jgi/Bigna1/83490/fgenesh1_pg.109_\